MQGYASWSGYGVRVVREAQLAMNFYGRQEICQPVQARQLLEPSLAASDREMFVTVSLDTRNCILGIETASIGSLNAAIVHPREIFKAPLLMGANSIILAHNHPSGNPLPSQDDIELTDRLKNAGQLLGIEVLDHLIIVSGAFHSFKEQGQL